MSENMKVAVFQDVRKIVVEEHPIPKVKEGYVLMKVEACGICTWEQRAHTGVKKIGFPFIGGHELSGVILELGENVDTNHWHVGDKVVVGVTLACKNCYQCRSGNEQNCLNFYNIEHLIGMPYKGMGGFSTHMLVQPSNLFHFDNVSWEEATITEPLSCVLHSVETAEIVFGDVVLIIGCGIMGLLHLTLSLKRGAQVIVSDVNPDRLEIAKKLGASYCINPSKEDLVGKLMEYTDNLKAQVVFDTTPISKLAEEATKCLNNNGRLILYSSFYPDNPITISPDWLHKSAVKLMGTANSNTIDFMKATRLISKGIVDVKHFVSKVYPLEKIAEALEDSVENEYFRVVIRMP